MITAISHVTILVADQDEALRFYTEKLGFVVTSDIPMGSEMRWLTVAPADGHMTNIALLPATNDEQKTRIGAQVADHVPLCVLTDNCQATYDKLKARGVKFRSEPTQQAFGIDAMFEDLYGNKFEMVQLTPSGGAS